MSIKSQETAKQFVGLPSTVYVNSHLLRAAQLANKVISLDYMGFGYQTLHWFGERKEDLDTIGSRVEFPGVNRIMSDDSWQRVDRSKLYDLEKYGKVSSDLKRRSLTRKGSKRYLDAVICYWFHFNDALLPFVGKTQRDGKPYQQLVLDNSSSPASYSIWFRVCGQIYRIILKGSGSDRRKRVTRKTGRTSSKIVTAEVVKTDSGLGSKQASTPVRYNRAVQVPASIVSAQPISTGLSYPGE